MRRLLMINVFCLLIGGLSGIACSDSEGGKGENSGQPIQLLSVSPVEGETNVPTGTVVVAFEFDQTVLLADKSKVTINSESTISVAAMDKRVLVNVEASPSRDYKITLGKGAIKSASGVSSVTEFSTTFSTKAADTKSPEATKLLSYLNDNYGKKMLSGTMANVNWNINEATWVYKHTGKWPAINSFDYIHAFASSPGGWIDYENTTVVEDWWNSGGIVAAMWHWNVLANDGVSYTYTPGAEMDASHTSFNMSKIDDVNSKEYKQIVKDLDKVAGYLKLLKNKNIPVIWRPLHEAAGNYYHPEWNGTAWFWWGYYGPEPFKKLWRLMYDRFVNVHGLDNLIWVWTYEDHNEWYPGDGYVDITGSDIYNQTGVSYFPSRYTAMNTEYAGKLAAMAECGNVSKISEQWAAGAKWSYFMPWYDYNRTKDTGTVEFESTEHEHANIAWWNDALNCDFVLTRDELPGFKNK